MKIDDLGMTKQSQERRLRIAVLNRIFSSTGGGAERYSIAMVERLAKDHDIHVFAQKINHQYLGVTYHQVPMYFTRPRWLNQLWYAAFTWWSTRQGFDVVHSHENTWHGKIQTVHVLPLKHTLFDRLTGWRWALRWLKVATSPRLLAYLLLEFFRFSRCDGRTIIVTSPSLRTLMAKTYPASTSRLEVITPGVDEVAGPATFQERVRAREQLGLPVNGSCILFVGNDYRKKGLEILIQSLKSLPSEVFIAVVGNTSQLKEFELKTSEAGLKDRVFFLGALKNVNDAYIAANCMVHPTLQDTFAMVVLEAMSHGLPVVTSSSTYCGISELLKNRVNALILENPRDTSQLSELITLLLREDGVSQGLKNEACRFASTYLWSAIALRQETLYYKVV